MSRVVIVGAGVIGLMCAYELRRSGFEVTLLDRSEPGSGCSSGNMGWIVPSFARPLPAPGLVSQSIRWMLDRSSPLHIALRADPALAGWLWNFWRHCNARDYHAGLEALVHLAAPAMVAFDRIRADGVEFEMHDSGVLFLFLSRAARDEVQRDLEFMTGADAGRPQALERDDVLRMEPRVSGEVAAGIYVPQERHVRPESLVCALLRRLESSGVQVRSPVNVTGIRRRGGQALAVVTDAGEVEGDLFLLAAGAWTGVLARMVGATIPLQGGKGYSISIDSPSWQPGHALYLDEARVAWSPFDGQLRAGGTMEFSGLSDRLDRRRIEAIRLSSSRYIREWPTGIRETTWAGLRPLTPDGLPVIGRLGPIENAFVATGHGMLGMTLAPSTAVVMEQLMRSGACDVDLSAFRPDRFH